MTEAQLQKAVIDTARMLGWKVAHFHDSRRQVRPGVFVGDKDAAGFPDLVLVRDRLVFAELKTDTGPTTNDQADWGAAIAHAGVEFHLWRPADWRAGRIEAALRGG